MDLNCSEKEFWFKPVPIIAADRTPSLRLSPLFSLNSLMSTDDGQLSDFMSTGNAVNGTAKAAPSLVCDPDMCSVDKTPMCPLGHPRSLP